MWTKSQHIEISQLHSWGDSRRASAIQNIVHKLQRLLKASKSPESVSVTFCGVDIEQLNHDQRRLMHKLSLAQAKEFSKKVTINKSQWQIEFLKIKKAIREEDLVNDETREWSIARVERLSIVWKLPEELDYTKENAQTLYKNGSDYDVMILQMPGDTSSEKKENFRLLTGMSGLYRTSNPNTIRMFTDHDSKRINTYKEFDKYNVRPVRSW